MWRFVHVAESQAQAEDELAAALLQTRRHMVHARATHNPADYRVDPAVRQSVERSARVGRGGVRYSLETSALCGTADRVAEQMAELRDAGVHHVLCQMSTATCRMRRSWTRCGASASTSDRASAERSPARPVERARPA